MPAKPLPSFRESARNDGEEEEERKEDIESDCRGGLVTDIGAMGVMQNTAPGR